MQPPFVQSIEQCFNGKIKRETYDFWYEKATSSLAGIKDDFREKRLPHFDIAYWQNDLLEQKKIANIITSRANTIIIYGVGGSSLGGQAICTAKLGMFSKQLPRLIFVDNLDASDQVDLLNHTDFINTHFLAISKSGTTLETLTQIFTTIEHMEKAGIKEIKSLFSFVVELGDNPMRNLARQFAIPVYEHPANLGGRYSVLSIVGLLPALLLGLDVKSIRSGAAFVLEGNISGNAASAVSGAALSMAALSCGLSQSVMMAYSNRLEKIAMWWRQLWAESLGKDGKGSTPITALAPVDQHSQLQLYLDGPNDKLFTVLELEKPLLDPYIKGQAYVKVLGVGGYTIGDIIKQQSRATIDVLFKVNRPVRRFLIPELNEAAIGGLFMHFMLETIITAALLNVNPFDQPAVEAGKLLTKKYLLIS